LNLTRQITDMEAPRAVTPFGGLNAFPDFN